MNFTERNLAFMERYKEFLKHSNDRVRKMLEAEVIRYEIYLQKKELVKL